MTLGFIDHVSNYRPATLNVFASVRKFYPNSPIFISVEGDNYDDCQAWDRNIEWLYNNTKLGYPPYTKDKVLEWLKRMYIGMLKLGTDHVMMVEDDMLVIDIIQYSKNIECFGHNITIGNYIHKSLLHEIETFSKHPVYEFTQYGAGGGSIFKCSTFIDNYARVTNYIDKNWDWIETIYWPECGYMDAFLTIFYLLCGKEYSKNPRMINLWPADYTSTPEELIATYGGDIDIIHNYKRFYNV